MCGSGSGPPAVCDNLCKQQVTCPPGQETTVTGTVFAPTPVRFGAADPLYNALVYVPNGPLAPFPAGVACDLCGTPVSGSPLVTALTGPDGKFTLKNVPAGDNIPLVIQIGRWRRQVTIPKVTACTSTALPAELTRLPRNQTEGDIPQMAIATGIYDPFECVLRKIGIDEAEFTLPTGTGRVHVYRYEGARLMQRRAARRRAGGQRRRRQHGALARYDMVLLPCDDDSMKLPGELRMLHDYTGKGGRLFLTDFSYTWLKDTRPEASSRAGPPGCPTGITWATTSPPWSTRASPRGRPSPSGCGWWAPPPCSASCRSTIPTTAPATSTAWSPPTQRWLYTEAPARPSSTSPSTPRSAPPPTSNAAGWCSAPSTWPRKRTTRWPSSTAASPRDCANRPMTPQEKALEFMLFDASACVQPDTERPRVFEPPPPAPPPPPPVVD